jgi:hypothetical protein
MSQHQMPGHFMRTHDGMNHRQFRHQRAQRPPLRSITTDRTDEDPNTDYYDDLYFYVASAGNMVAGAVVAATVNIQADSKFEWMRSSVYGNLNGATPPIASGSLLPVSVFISDTGSGRQLMSAAVPVGLLAGDGKLPFINPASRIFKPSSTIQITFTNFSASQYDNVYFAFLGRKIFKGGPPAQS